MRKKLIIGAVIFTAVMVSVITTVCLRSKDRKDLSQYSEDAKEAVNTETDAIKMNSNGSYYFEKNNMQVFIPTGFEMTESSDSTFYWCGNIPKDHSQTDTENDISISISYEPNNSYEYDDLQTIYYEKIADDYVNVNASTVKINENKFICYDYSDNDYFYRTMLITEKSFKKNGNHLICITVMSDRQAAEDMKEIIMIMAGNSYYKGE